MHHRLLAFSIVDALCVDDYSSSVAAKDNLSIWQHTTATLAENIAAHDRRWGKTLLQSIIHRVKTREPQFRRNPDLAETVFAETLHHVVAQSLSTAKMFESKRPISFFRFGHLRDGKATA